MELSATKFESPASDVVSGAGDVNWRRVGLLGGLATCVCMLVLGAWRLERGDPRDVPVPMQAEVSGVAVTTGSDRISVDLDVRAASGSARVLQVVDDLSGLKLLGATLTRASGQAPALQDIRGTLLTSKPTTFRISFEVNDCHAASLNAGAINVRYQNAEASGTSVRTASLSGMQAGWLSSYLPDKCSQ